MSLAKVLILDDEVQVRECVRRQLAASGYETAGAASSIDALNMLRSRFFDLVVCDLCMPGSGGIEFLRQAIAHHPDTGVVLMSGIHDLQIAVEAMRLGALDYISKPFTADQIAHTVAGALGRLRERTERHLYLQRLEDSLLERGVELSRTSVHLRPSDSTLNALVAALDAREHETEAHSRRVGEYALHLAETMGIAAGPREDIRKGALLHDIGKIGISDRILLKPGKLTPEEWIEMRKHPEIGYWILTGSREFRSSVRNRHRAPRALGRQRLSQSSAKEPIFRLGARIFSVVDTFDALTSNRPYHRSESYETARKEIETNAGTQFDPESG